MSSASDEMRSDFMNGIKLATLGNWLDQDEAWRPWRKFSPELMGYVPDTAESWLEDVHTYSVSAKVPTKIRKLYEVARNAIIYGFFCYSLLTLGVEQLLRVLEASVRIKAADLGCKPKPMPNGHSDEVASYGKSIQFLIEKGLISIAEANSWDAARNLRNYASHPKMQTILLPSHALGQLRLTAQRINALYEGSE
ncbi:MAG TPA: hypothetical protein VGF56_16345 [Rhizomicrobium sp.]|jgi:hypothetical protein